ncbi:hypothetical protein [Sorangium sp. So ce381]|uniref:hypothetical protein n=1 Tax=Sorangium sp. So ce381 TaxID=3133307 RepID=UPI003F5BDE2D
MSLEQLLQSDAFLNDARRFAAIPDDAFEAALKAVHSAPGFLGPRRLHAVARAAIADSKQAASFAHFVINFAELGRDTGIRTSALVDSIAEELPDSLSDAERRSIVDRLPQTLAPVLGVELQAKVDRVVRKTGSHLDELAMISDLRPVFDEDGERVEGLVPLTTLKLVVHQSGALSPTVVEVRITEEELDDLCVQAARAKRKLAALKKLVSAQNGIELPESIMTLSDTPST